MIGIRVGLSETIFRIFISYKIFLESAGDSG